MRFEVGPISAWRVFWDRTVRNLLYPLFRCGRDSIRSLWHCSSIRKSLLRQNLFFYEITEDFLEGQLGKGAKIK